MAPRTAKSKKVADVKVSENDAPNKGRGKAKDIEKVEQELPEIDLNGKGAAATDKKPKRGKKANESNGEHTNGEETAPPAKRGRKKNVDEPVPEEKAANGDHSNEEESQSVEELQNGDQVETNGHAEEASVSTGKGRKKQTKKEDKPAPKPKETTRGRKAKPEGGDAEEKEEVKEVVEEKPKGKGRGRKAQPKADPESETEEKTETVVEEVRPEPAATKGRGRKAQPKADPESETEEKTETVLEEVRPEPVATKGRGRKAQAKANPEPETEEKHESVEEEVKVEPAATKGRGRKAQPKADPQPETEEKTESVEEDIKAEPSATKGRGRKAQPKPDPDPETEENTESVEEEVKAEPSATKGRKKAQPKEKAAAKEKSPPKEKSPIPEKEESPEDQTEDQPAEEPKKKETKGRKGQGKKAPSKEPSEEKDEVEKEEPALKKRKINKKDDKGETIDEKANDEVSESKPKGKRGKKAAELAAESPEEEPQDTGEDTVTKRKRKPTDEKAADKKPANKHVTNYEEIDFSNTSKTAQGKEWNFKISSWNVDGIRAWMGKGGLDYLKYEKPDILCLQETKCSQDKLPEEVLNVPGYHAYWLASNKEGYAGVGIYTTRLAMNVQYGIGNEEFDDEGRMITAEYEHFYLICTYVPNAGRGLVTLPKRLKWNEEFRKYVKELDTKKPIIICGDMNVAHNEIDLANPKSNKKNAGFTPEERAGMTELLDDGFVDTFRRLHPDAAGAYTFWSFMGNSRAKNVGWRLDYFIVSERLLPSICDNVIRNQVYGSDHCPLTLFLHLSSADKPTE